LPLNIGIVHKNYLLDSPSFCLNLLRQLMKSSHLKVNITHFTNGAVLIRVFDLGGLI